MKPGFVATLCCWLGFLFLPAIDGQSLRPVATALADGGGFERGVDGATTSSRSTKKTTKRARKKTTTTTKTGTASKKSTPHNLARIPAITTRVPDFRTGQILVAFPAAATDQTINAVARDFGLRRLTDTTVALLDRRIVKFSRPADLPPDRALQLAADPRVDRVQPNYLYGLTAGPAPQYAIEKMAVPKAHGVALGRNVLVAVVDSGVDKRHPALKGAVADEFNPLGKRKGVFDMHGTAVSSIIAARRGMTGVAPAASILSVRAFGRPKRNRPTTGETFDLLRGIDWATSKGAQILNLSFAGPNDPMLRDIIAAAGRAGVVTVAAAGNRGPKAPPAFPAAYPAVIAVTATDAKDRIYKNSNQGAHVAVAAPGVDILAAGRRKGYGLMSGTSFSAAYISGSIALILEGHPKSSTSASTARLTAAARDLGPAGHDIAFGHGLVDAYKAVNDATQ